MPMQVNVNYIANCAFYSRSTILPIFKIRLPPSEMSHAGQSVKILEVYL